MVFRSERQEEVIVKPYQSLECHAARDRMHLSHSAIIKAAVPPAKRLRDWNQKRVNTTFQLSSWLQSLRIYAS